MISIIINVIVLIIILTLPRKLSKIIKNQNTIINNQNILEKKIKEIKK